MTRIVIIGGGPAGYEAALVAAQLGAEVTVVERDGLGGASVLTDCVPSKTLIAAAGAMTSVRDSAVLGLQGADAGHRPPRPRHGQPPGQGPGDGPVRRHPRAAACARACASSRAAAGSPTRSAAWPTHRVEVVDADGAVTETLETDVVLHRHRRRPARADGRRARRRADPRLARRLRARGDARAPRRRRLRRHRCRVRLRLPRGRRAGHPRLLPRPGAARRGLRRRRPSSSRSSSPRRPDRRARPRRRRAGAPRRASLVELTDGRTVEGSHALMTVGTVPNTDRAQPRAVRRGDVAESGHIVVDRVSRTSVSGHLRRRRRDRRLPAGLGRRHAGPHRHVARPRRGGDADPAQDRLGQRLHPPGDRHGRRPGEVPARGRRTSTSSGCRWPPTPAPR